MSQPREQEQGSIPFVVAIILKLISGLVVTILMTATCQFGHAIYYGERSEAIEPFRNAGITVRNFYQQAQEGTITWGPDQEESQKDLPNFRKTEPPRESQHRGGWPPYPTEARQEEALSTATEPQAFQEPTAHPFQGQTTAPPARPFGTKTPDPEVPLLLVPTSIPPLNLPPASTPAPPPAPRAFQPATPTPIPPNIHTGTVGQYSYSIQFPQGWLPETETDGHAVFTSPGGTAGAEIRIGRLGSGGSTASLVERRNEELLERIRAAARTGTSDVYETKPHQPPPTTVTDQLSQAWQMEYRWRESSEQCLRDVVDVVSPSNRFTHSILISAWVCEDSLDKEAETERQEILGSFRGNTIR